MASNALQDHPDQNRAERLLLGVELDEIGNVLYIYDQQVDALDVPSMTPVFGTIQSELYNERNRRRSRLKSIEVDVLDLFQKLSQDRMAAQELGGGKVTTTVDLEDASVAFPDATTVDLTLLSSQVEHKGRAHAVRVDQRVDGWSEITKTEIVKHPDAGGNRLVETREVKATGAALPTGATIIDARNERLDDAKVNQIVRKAPDGFGVLTQKNLLDGEAQGIEADENVQIVNLPYTMPAATYLTVKSILQNLGNGKGKYVRKDVSSWPVYVDEDEEHTTGKEVKITREIVNSATFSYTKGTARIYHSVKHLDSKKALHTKREIDASVLTDTWTEYHNVQYYFPTYLQPGAPFSVLNSGNGFVIAPNQSSDLSVKIPCRFEITYHTTPQIPLNIFQFKPVDLNLIATDWRLSLRDVICDSGTLYVRTTDGSGGFVSMQWDLPASSPTATEYINTIMGTEKLIADESVRWKYNLYRRTKVYMTIPDLDLGMNTQIGYY